MTASGCEGWSIQKTVGHLVAAAEQTRLNSVREIAAAKFNFDAFAEKGAARTGAARTEELIRRLRARTTTTNGPPAPPVAMLGEIVVHGDDVRRPLGIANRSPEAALIAIADGWKNSNFVIGSKRRIEGLRLRATDASWSHGEGPEVSGPLQSLVLAMTGRRASHHDLSGDGLSVLAARK